MLVWFDTEATFGGGALFGSVGVLRQGSWLMCLGMAVGCLAGCGGADDGFAYQPVSGVVTVDGEPVAGLTVSFAPQTAALESGRPSVATTDEEGRYVAKTLDGVVGAAVGEHLVSITAERLDPETQEVLQPETIPARYNRRTGLRLSVPSGGTQEANFALESK